MVTWQGVVGCLVEGGLILGYSFFSSRGEEELSILREWKFNFLLMSFTSPQLCFYFSSIFYLQFLVAADFGAGTVRFSKYFSEIHSPCHKRPQRGVTILPWITSPDWILRILNNFSFSEVVWLPLIWQPTRRRRRKRRRKRGCRFVNVGLFSIYW